MVSPIYAPGAAVPEGAQRNKTLAWEVLPRVGLKMSN
jgi:hypothetical protein